MSADRFEWVWPREIEDFWRELADDFVELQDMSPATQKISRHWSGGIKYRIRQGDGFMPLSDETIRRHGEHRPLMLEGTLINSIQPVWSPVNAAVKAKAPHAHFSDRGTKSYEGGSPWYERDAETGKQHRLARKKSEALRRSMPSNQHEPQRQYMYPIENALPLYDEMVLDRIVEVITGK